MKHFCLVRLLNAEIDKTSLGKGQTGARQYQYLSGILSGDDPRSRDWRSTEGDSLWFETETKRCIIFDTISFKFFGRDQPFARLAQADIAILVI